MDETERDIVGAMAYMRQTLLTLANGEEPQPHDTLRAYTARHLANVERLYPLAFKGDPE